MKSAALSSVTMPMIPAAIPIPIAADGERRDGLWFGIASVDVVSADIEDVWYESDMEGASLRAYELDRVVAIMVEFGDSGIAGRV